MIEITIIILLIILIIVIYCGIGMAIAYYLQCSEPLEFAVAAYFWILLPLGFIWVIKSDKKEKESRE